MDIFNVTQTASLHRPRPSTLWGFVLYLKLLLSTDYILKTSEYARGGLWLST